MKQLFKIKQNIISTDVDRKIIDDLESFFLKRGSEFLNLNEEDSRKYFKITIIDKFGHTEIDAIDKYDLSTFTEDVQEISLRFNYSDYKVLDKIEILLTFSKSRENSNIILKIDGNNSREIAIGVLDNIQRILKTKKNFHALYHPKPGWDFVFLGLTFLSIWTSLKLMTHANTKLVIILLLLGMSYVFYYLILKNLKPYSAFENNKMKSNDAIVNFLISGFIGLILFGTFFTEIRNWLMK